MTSSSPSQSPGLLVVGHGTLDVQGQQDFWTTVEQVANLLPETVVEGGFLEFAAPDIPTAIATLAHRGVQDLVVVPLLLFSAGHAERDIPAAVAQAVRETGWRVRQSAVLGRHPLILQVSAERFRTAIGRAYTPDEVLWLVVGRGHRDRSAVAEMGRFIADRRALTPVNQVMFAFLALAEPCVEQVIPQAAARDVATVVVQPHLLYPGKLLARLARSMEQQEGGRLRQQWVLADCLGCHPAIARVVVERFQETLAQETLAQAD